MIRFEKVTPSNFDQVVHLQMKDSQISFMENNIYSLAEAKVFDYLEPRAIYNDDTLIGFMLFYYQPDGVIREMGPGEGLHEIKNDGMDYIYFKRFMLDKKFQGQGLGKAAMMEATKFFKTEYPNAGFVELMHYMDNETGASLYEAAGFVPTGEIRKTPRPGADNEYDEELVRRMYY